MHILLSIFEPVNADSSKIPYDARQNASPFPHLANGTSVANWRSAERFRAYLHGLEWQPHPPGYHYKLVFPLCKRKWIAPGIYSQLETYQCHNFNCGWYKSSNGSKPTRTRKCDNNRKNIQSRYKIRRCSRS